MPNTPFSQIERNWFSARASISARTPDDSGQGYLASLVSIVIPTPGVLGGNGLFLNGVTSYVDVGNPANITGIGSGNFTVLAWVNTTNTGARKAIFSFGDGSATNKAGYLFINTSNNLEFDVSNNAGPTGNINLTDGNWHHVAVTNTSGTIQLYTDGVTDGNSGSLSPNISTGGCRIGRSLSTDGAQYPFNGGIDEVKFYKRALSGTEITNDSQGKSNSVTNLVGVWHLEIANAPLDDLKLAYWSRGSLASVGMKTLNEVESDWWALITGYNFARTGNRADVIANALSQYSSTTPTVNNNENEFLFYSTVTISSLA